MTQEEKDRLLILLEHPSRWCQGAEARDRRGEAVHYNDAGAVSWDLAGGMCHLFGWNRSVKLFVQTWRQLADRPAKSQGLDPERLAMRWLQDFNDVAATDHEFVITRIRDLKVRP